MPCRLVDPQDLNADFDKALASPSQATREVSHCILVVFHASKVLWLRSHLVLFSMLLYVFFYDRKPPVSWIATRLDLGLLRLSKWAWAYTWLHRCIKQSRQFSMWELEASVNLWWVKTKAIYLYICLHLICLSQKCPQNIFIIINSQADLHCLKKAARGSQTYRHGINRSIVSGWKHLASPFRTMDAVPSPIASVAWASWCRRYLQMCFFLVGCETVPVFFPPGVDIVSVERILKCTPVFFFFFSISDFFMISCKNHILAPCFGALLQFCWTKMATGSVDNGLQESFHGLRVKGEACVWCGGVSGWLRWDEVDRLVFRALLGLLKPA